jgi:hypothetical protein
MFKADPEGVFWMPEGSALNDLAFKVYHNLMIFKAFFCMKGSPWSVKNCGEKHHFINQTYNIWIWDKKIKC